MATSRQLKRMESVTRSPIYAYFTEVLSGASTIRAFKQEELFIAESERRIDQNQKCQYAFVISNLWVSLRLELIGAAIVFFTCLFVLRGRESLEGGSAGLAVTYALSITIYLNILARQLSELENNIVAVERLSELIEAPQVVYKLHFLRFVFNILGSFCLNYIYRKPLGKSREQSQLLHGHLLEKLFSKIIPHAIEKD